MSAPQSDTATTAEATSDAVLTPAGGSGNPALPDADAASVDAVLEPVDVDEDDEDEEGAEGLLVREGDEVSADAAGTGSSATGSSATGATAAGANGRPSGSANRPRSGGSGNRSAAGPANRGKRAKRR